MYRISASVVAALLAYVGLVLLVLPGFHVDTLGVVRGVGVDTSGAVMGRRSAPFYLAMAGLLLLSLSAAGAALRKPVGLATAGALLLLAAIGLFDWIGGRVSGDIRVAIAADLGAGLWLGWAARRL